MGAKERPMDDLKNALRIVAFVKVPAGALRPSWARILLLAALTCAAPTVFSLLTLDAAGTWNVYGAPGILFVACLVFLLAAALAVAMRRDEAMPEILHGLLLAWIAIDIVSYAALAGLAWHFGLD